MKMKPRFDAVLEMCVENGLALGYNRAHKHDEHPTEQMIFDYQRTAIFDEIYQWFDMEDNNADQ